MGVTPLGRPRKPIDDTKLLSLRGEGRKLEEISKTLGCSIPTLSRRLAILNHEKGILTKYRQLQGLQLTELQAQLLKAAESKDFENASLTELLQAFHVLKKAEMAIQGKASFKMKGLLDHLLALENDPIKE